MTLFDTTSSTTGPPPEVPVNACGDEMAVAPKGWKLRRRPRCNRPAGHTGPHQEIRARDFWLKAQWGGDGDA